MLCHYSDNIVYDVNNCITYNGGGSLLLNGNLGISYVEMKENIYHRLVWSYNDIDVEITWMYQIGEHQYYLVPIVCDGIFKTIIDFFIQSGLNMMLLYVSSQSNLMCPNFTWTLP